MTRINFLIGWSERSIGIALPNTVPPALRLPVLALAAAIGLVVLLFAVQAARLRTVEQEGAAFDRRLSALDAGVARVRAVERDVMQLRALTDRVARIRRSGNVRASEIAALGNRLPAGVWLTSLRADRGVVALEGRSVQLASVGVTMDALVQLPAYSAARLVAVREAPARHGVTYSVELEPR